MAPGGLHPLLAAMAVLCIAVGAGAAAAINMWYDRDIDALMVRARTRPIPAGRMASATALAFGITVPLETQYRKFAGDGGGGAPGFATPSRKVEIYSETLLDHGYAPLPEYVEPAMGPVARPDLGDDFPLILTSAKSSHYLQSQLRGLPALRRLEPDPRVELHPDTAAARGIEHGAWVALVTPHGRMRAKAHFSSTLHPRVVSATHGWWQACEALSQPGYEAESEAGANMNAVIGNDAVDPISGSVPFKSYLCQVTRLTKA